ncbi:MAG: hypothetical protein K0Q78_1555 [Cellvibrio sp.]|nr:hypothetical protein [Cellvibrio sp.]
MQENIYAAPEANLATATGSSVEPAFYVVSPVKFLMLYFFTFSFYGLYWHYKNWSQYKIFYRDSEPMPIMRAIFSIFFTHGLFSVIDMRIKDQQRDYSWNPTVWATIGVIALLGARLIDRFTASGSMSEPIEFVPFPLIIVYGIVLLKAQCAINMSCNDPGGKSNSNFTLANCAWIFFGTIFYCLTLIGLFLLDDF